MPAPRSPDVPAIMEPDELAASIIYQGINGYPWSELDPKSNYRHLYRGIGRRVVKALEAAKESA